MWENMLFSHSEGLQYFGFAQTQRQNRNVQDFCDQNWVRSLKRNTTLQKTWLEKSPLQVPVMGDFHQFLLHWVQAPLLHPLHPEHMGLFQLFLCSKTQSLQLDLNFTQTRAESRLRRFMTML